MSAKMPFAALLTFRGDSDLIARLKHRDSEAMGILYDRFGKTAFDLILRIVKDREVAEDLLAETFVEAWNRAPGFGEDHGSLGLWIFAFARNHSLEYLRSSSKRPFRTDSTGGLLEQPRMFENFFTIDHALDRVREMRQAFTALEDNERQVLQLAYFEGLTESEIAARLEQPPSVAGSWIRTALEKLRGGGAVTNS